MRATADVLARAYFATKSVVLDAGCHHELERVLRRIGSSPTESDFLRESAWVVLCSGMKTSVVASKFDAITSAFLRWRSAAAIDAAREDCVEMAFPIYRHRAKLVAIAEIARTVSERGFSEILADHALRPVESLRTLPFVGPVTAFHLAKNLGHDVAKPDRHLTRFAAAAGQADAIALCAEISRRTGDPTALVDSVLWRFATLHRTPVQQWEMALTSAVREHRRYLHDARRFRSSTSARPAI